MSDSFFFIILIGFYNFIAKLKKNKDIVEIRNRKFWTFKKKLDGYILDS